MTAPPAGALEGCPFCGGEAHLTFDEAFGGFVSCSTEGCAGNAHVAQHDRSQIIAAWNRRTHGPALLAALREWRPIESAPKDGSLFLGWVAAERWSAVDGGGSGRSADTSDVDFCQWRNMATGGFYENMMGQIGDAQDITHWMPLPAPPTADDLARVLEQTK